MQDLHFLLLKRFYGHSPLRMADLNEPFITDIEFINVRDQGLKRGIVYLVRYYYLNITEFNINPMLTKYSISALGRVHFEHERTVREEKARQEVLQQELVVELLDYIRRQP